MIYTLTKNPTIIVDGIEQPYAINYSLAELLAEHLELRINTVNPSLEYRVAKELRLTGEVELTDNERLYIQDVVISLPIENLIKGQILKCLILLPTQE